MIKDRHKYLITQLLSESLTEEEQREFDAALEEDPSFRHHVSAMKVALQKEAFRRPELHASTMKVPLPQEDLKRSSHRAKPRFRLLLPLSLAAAIALVIVAYLYLPEWTSSPEERWLSKANAREETSQFVTMGSADSLATFGAFFDEGKYEAAIQMRLSLPSSSAKYGRYQLYLGICYMRSQPNDLNKAVQSFLNARKASVDAEQHIIAPEQYYKASAYLAYAYAGLGQWADCKTVATQIHPNADSYTSFEIAALLEEANKHLK